MAHLLREGETSLFRELKDAGYYIWMNARNDLVAGQIPGLAESHADEIHYASRVGGKTPADAPAKEAYNERMRRQYPYSHFDGVKIGMIPTDLNDIDAAIERIKTPTPDGKPLCLFLGLNNPHPPYTVESKYFEKIDATKLPPRIKKEDLTGKSRIMDKIREYAGLEDWTEQDWEEVRTIYLAQCAKVDDWFGQICDALKEAGLYDNSCIFVLSDHGDFAGEYDLTEKAQNTFEDCLVKVPLLIKPPKGSRIDAGITDSLAELVDFYATVFDYAGVEPRQDHFGKSLRPVIEDRSCSVRDFAHCEGGRRPSEIQCDEFHAAGENGPGRSNPYWAKMMAQTDDLAHEKGTMITDGIYKYVQRLSGQDEFYNLIRDPGETKNLFEERCNSKELLRLRDALLDWYQESCDIVPHDYDCRFTSECIWLAVKPLCPKDKETEMRDYIAKGTGIMECIRYAMELSAKK